MRRPPSPPPCPTPTLSRTQGDLDAPLPAELRGRVDLLLANVPYVPSDEVALLPAEARLHEPRSALDGGPDGLDLLRDRKSTRLNSSHANISYAVFCLKKTK